MKTCEEDGLPMTLKQQPSNDQRAGLGRWWECESGHRKSEVIPPMPNRGLGG